MIKSNPSIDTIKKPEELSLGEFVNRATVNDFMENAVHASEYVIQRNKPQYHSGDADGYPPECDPLLETIAKLDFLSPWEYRGRCAAGQLINRDPALMPFTYICSQYRANSEKELQEHIALAEVVCRLTVAGGEIPIAPHLYFPRFMDDNDPFERYYGLGAGRKLMDICHRFVLVTVDGVISEGMQQEIEYANMVLNIGGEHIELTRSEALAMINKEKSNQEE